MDAAVGGGTRRRLPRPAVGVPKSGSPATSHTTERPVALQLPRRLHDLDDAERLDLGIAAPPDEDPSRGADRSRRPIRTRRPVDSQFLHGLRRQSSRKCVPTTLPECRGLPPRRPTLPRRHGASSARPSRRSGPHGGRRRQRRRVLGRHVLPGRPARRRVEDTLTDDAELAPSGRRAGHRPLVQHQPPAVRRGLADRKHAGHVQPWQLKRRAELSARGRGGPVPGHGLGLPRRRGGRPVRFGRSCRRPRRRPRSPLEPFPTRQRDLPSERCKRAGRGALARDRAPRRTSHRRLGHELGSLRPDRSR